MLSESKLLLSLPKSNNIFMCVLLTLNGLSARGEQNESKSIYISK